ncbi:MAG: phage tail protein [Planctomycetota bacterium]|jgi:hypothetical protein
MMADAMVEVRYDKAELQRVRRILKDIPGALPGVMSRAVNRTAGSTKVEIARRISAESGIKVSAVKKGIFLHRATRRSWVAVLDIIRKRIPLIRFKGSRRTKRGVKAPPGIRPLYLGRKKLPVTGGLIPSAFKQTMPSGHTGFFRRWRPSTRRLPIAEIYGPSPGDVFEGAGDIARQVTRSTEQTLERNIDSQVRYVLEKC